MCLPGSTRSSSRSIFISFFILHRNADYCLISLNASLRDSIRIAKTRELYNADSKREGENCSSWFYLKKPGELLRGLQEECTALLRAIFVFTLSQVFVIRKLSSIEPIIFSNFFIGMAKVRISTGTQGRADGSNIPNTARG